MACNAISIGIREDAVIATILLHDVCEDCGVDPALLPVGDAVRHSVELLTFSVMEGESKEIAKNRYYNMIQQDRAATLTKLIDRCLICGKAVPSMMYKVGYGRKAHSGGFHERRKARGKARAGTYLQDFYERVRCFDDEDRLVFQWMPRGKLLSNAQIMVDWECFDHRARHSTGWKEHKYPRQWEHNVIEREKHEKNRLRKETRKRTGR